MNNGEHKPSVNRDRNNPPRKTRTRSGCLVCRRRRRKCDELRPECMNCRQRGDVCEWGMKITFRTDNATQIDSEHPSMQEGSKKRARHFKIVNVTSKVEKVFQTKFHQDAPTREVSQVNMEVQYSTRNEVNNEDTISPHHQGRSDHHRQADRNNGGRTGYHRQWESESPSFDTPNSMTISYPDDSSFQVDEEYVQVDRGQEVGLGRSLAYHPEAVHNLEHSGRALHNATAVEYAEISCHQPSDSQSNKVTEEVAADLLALRYHPSQNQSIPSHTKPPGLMLPSLNRSPIGNASQPQMHKGGIFDVQYDGIFLPGSAYQEFHSTLRDHLIYTARSNAPTRNTTPELRQPELAFGDRIAPKGVGAVERGDLDLTSGRTSKPPEITCQREYILWKTWIGELAPWLDKFDNNRHFEHKIPMMAKNTPHLKNSILALSARQIEMKENSKSSSESLALYQEAIHLLLPELETKSTQVIASCVVLCVLEMMSCSPNEWRRHLEGCANLLEAVGINGFSGGVEEALFWCFARMDLCGALISQDVTLIPVHRWASTSDFPSDVRLFRNPMNGFDTYANYAVFLCANCVAYLKDCDRQIQEGKIRRWIELLDLLDDWHNERSEEMRPVLTIPAGEGGLTSPFPTVFYGNGPAVSGNQLYHTAVLLMLQKKPPGLQVQRKQKSIFWHARQICAISESNTHHGAWTNSIQPIWIAGKVMSHSSEHKAILNILERIERETGWVTSWRREDLKAWWGDADE